MQAGLSDRTRHAVTRRPTDAGFVLEDGIPYDLDVGGVLALISEPLPGNRRGGPSFRLFGRNGGFCNAVPSQQQFFRRNVAEIITSSLKSLPASRLEALPLILVSYIPSLLSIPGTVLPSERWVHNPAHPPGIGIFETNRH